MYHRRCVVLAVDSTVRLKINTHTHKSTINKTGLSSGRSNFETFRRHGSTASWAQTLALEGELSVSSLMFLYWYNASDKIVWGPGHGTAISCRPVIAEALIRPKASICGVCDGRSGNGAGFCPNNWIFPCNYNSSNPINWFTEHSPALYNLSNLLIIHRHYIISAIYWSFTGTI
jgi:hypothetical protein